MSLAESRVMGVRRLRCSHSGMKRRVVMTNSDGTARVIINECSACGLNVDGETP